MARMYPSHIQARNLSETKHPAYVRIDDNETKLRTEGVPSRLVRCCKRCSVGCCWLVSSFKCFPWSWMEEKMIFCNEWSFWNHNCTCRRGSWGVSWVGRLKLMQNLVFHWITRKVSLARSVNGRRKLFNVTFYSHTPPGHGKALPPDRTAWFVSVPLNQHLNIHFTNFLNKFKWNSHVNPGISLFRS